MSSSPGIAYDSPIMSDEARNFVGNERDYVLHYGMQNDRASRKIQDGAYVNVRHKIVRREDSARAMIISANVLSMSVMSSQLSMYRWKVNEASNIAQATSILQEQVISATKKGYRVHRDRPKPLPYSKYADGAGLQKLMQKKMEKIQRNKQRRADRQAAARAAEREAQLKGIPYAPAAPMEDSDEDDFGIFKDDGSSSGGDDRDGGSRHSRSSSCCSAEDPNYDASKIGSSSTPADAITRLVIVDSYTHEPFEDILTHIRFLDEKYGLQLVVLLLLPTGKDLEAIQGSGKLLMPRFQTNIGDAYKCGFDLVLTHFFDHMVVDFLTNTFMSAAGRWRNDIRAKAAVGNYISLKNVLLGRIDIDALKALVWNDQVDDAELLEVIGNNTLALQGEAKRYTMAGQKLSRFASGISSHPGTSSGVGGGSSTASGLDGGGGADVLVLSEDSASMLNRSSHGDGNEITMSLLPNSMPQLRSREHTRNGVRSSGAKHGMLSSLTTQHDMLSAVMDPASQVQHAVRRLRRGANPDEEDEDAYEYVLVNHEEEQRAFMMESVEKELGRLIADNESKESTIQLLQTELERVTRTVNILKKHQDGLAASGEGGGHGKRVHAQAVERPDSGALVNLTKEQQIYILKERLEAANDQIMALMDSGAGKGGRRPNRGGISPSSKYRLHPGASRRGRGVDAGDDGGGMGATSAYQLYHEHREADMMRLFDFDAELVDAPAILHVPHGLVKGSPQRGSNNNSSRRDREQADKVISSLQEELLELQRRGFSGGDDGMSQRLVGKLQSALDQLSAQKQRISQLEELRKMDEVLRTNELKRLKDAKGGGGDGDEKGGGRKRRGKSGKAGAASSMTGMDESTTSTDVGAGRRGGGGGKRSGGLATANASLSGPAENAALAKAKAEYEEKLVAAAKKAEAQMQRERDDMHMHYQLELSRREKEMKPILNRLYLKIRRPYTKSYRTVLQKEANEAQGNARGAWQRLRFAVSQITDDQLRPPTQHRDRDGRRTSAAEDDEEEERGVVGRIADPDLRHQVEALAQEHAGFMLQADTAKREMEVIDAAFEADGRARYAELKEKRQALLEVAETTAKRSAKLEDYLGALKDVAEVEQEMGRWGDVDIGSHLTLTRTSSKLYRSRVDVDEEAEEPSGMSPVLATATTVASGNSSNTTNPAPMPLRVATTMSSEDDGALLHVVVTEASPTRSMDPHGSIITSVHTSDAGGMLRDIADAYRVAAGPLSRPPSESPLRRGGSKKSSPRGAGAGQSSHSRGLLSVEDGGWSEASASTSTIMLASALPDVQAVRQMSFSIASFEAMLKGLAESDAPEAEVQLYQHALQRFQDGLVHPDRMAEIGQQLRDRHLPPSLSIMAQVYATHRQELRRLLQLLSFTYPGLVPIAGFTEQGLDQQLLASLERIPQTSDEVRVPLVVANDTSLLTWAIEYIGTIVTQQREFMWVDGAIPPEAVDGFRRDQQLLEVLRANIPLRYLDEDDRRVQTYADVVAQQLGGDSTIAQQLNRFAAAGKAGASGGDDSPPSARSHNLTPYQSITSHISSHRKTSTGPRTPRRSGSNSTDAFPHMTEAGMVAEDLAAMFTKQHVGINPAELSAEEVYLREVVDSDDPNNDNVRIMRDIKQELAYINALKHQRMEELLLRYRIRQREIAYAEARAAAAAANAQNQKEARSMEIPDFEVKSGSPAWYGMEAAKRVKDILKRQKGPDQVVVGSSGVGIEVSRRSAFPRPPPREVRIIQTPRERLRAARHLPPIHRGLSQAQKQAGADENIDPYIDPRDGASLAAFSQIASYYDFDARDQLLFYTPDELEHRVMDFREYLNRASSRRGTTGDSANGAAQFNLRLGESPYLPIKVGTPQPASRGQNTNNNNNTTTTLPQGRPVPVTTSWTYGVPSQHVRAMLDQPSNQHDSVLFVPSQQTSEEGARYARNRVPRGNNRLLTASNPYASPAALAAQRLNAMLRMSMEDPTIGGGAAVSGAGVGAMMGQSWTPSRRPTRHMRGDDGHREAAAPANATTTSPSRAAARRHTSTSRVLMQTNLDGASTASPRNSPPMDIATNGRLTAEDSGAPGFPSPAPSHPPSRRRSSARASHDVLR